MHVAYGQPDVVITAINDASSTATYF